METVRKGERLKTIKDIYRIGRGPSSSHTMGPEKAAKRFLAEHPDADRFEVTLYGSLALTGEGHGTDRVLRETLGGERTEIIFCKVTDFPLPHPNTLDFCAYRQGKLLDRRRVMSVGGGEIVWEGESAPEEEQIYPHNTFSGIEAYCRAERLTLPAYAERFEKPGLREHLASVWETMKASVREGLAAEGILPGGLGVRRKAKLLAEAAPERETPAQRESRMISACAFAVSEQNAAGGVISTAPTCGACGVVPAVLYRAQIESGYTDGEILDALAVAGLIGNVVRTNASISGAECGCQAEIGTACSMAAAALAALRGLNFLQIGCAAETAMEHNIGLTCDPVCGLVQIPCIERNAVGAQRAVHAAMLAETISDTQKISFDCIVQNMYETGKDLLSAYRETAVGGLAKLYGKEPGRGKIV